MKKIGILALSALISLSALAQGGKVLTAGTYIDNYVMGQDANDLVEAKEAIDDAVVHDKTKTKGKTWYFHALTYLLIGEDESLRETTKNATLTALSSFQKTAELNEGKTFYMQDEMNIYIQQLGADLFNTGIEYMNVEDYETAMKYYSGVGDADALAKKYGVELTFDPAIAEEEAVKAAVLAGKGEEILEKLDKAIYYNIIVEEYMKAENYERSKELIDMGLEKFPEDANLYFKYINIALKEDNTQAAMDKIDKAISLQSENDQLYFIRGKAYEDMGDKVAAQADYDKAIALNPSNINALNNAGALFFNQANELIEQMNELDWRETAKYDELNAERKELYKQALPYFEQLLEHYPEDDAATRAITKINSALATE